VAGCFITLEGIEGSGKTSQQLRLVERLRTRDVAVLALREPGGTPLAEEVRALLLARRGPDGRESRVAPWSEAFLMLAARAQLVSEVVRPALAAGTWVVCDRFTDSTVAYQGGGRGLDRAMLARLNQAATGGLAPDLTLLFDLPVGEALARRLPRAGARRAGPLRGGGRGARARGGGGGRVGSGGSAGRGAGVARTGGPRWAARLALR
jgi:dTMP kinase